MSNTLVGSVLAEVKAIQWYMHETVVRIEEDGRRHVPPSVRVFRYNRLFATPSLTDAFDWLRASKFSAGSVVVVVRLVNGRGLLARGSRDLQWLVYNGRHLGVHVIVNCRSPLMPTMRCMFAEEPQRDDTLAH